MGKATKSKPEPTTETRCVVCGSIAAEDVPCDVCGSLARKVVDPATGETVPPEPVSQ